MEASGDVGRHNFHSTPVPGLHPEVPMFWKSTPAAIRSSCLGLFFLVRVVDIGYAQTGPPPIGGSVSTCCAQLEYFSEAGPTWKEPRFPLTNRIRRADSKNVTDIAWTKPGLFSIELIVGAETENSYPFSDYFHDRNALIKIWSQECLTTAEAYLIANEEKAAKGLDLSLRGLLSRLVEAKPETTGSDEYVVSLRGESLRLDGQSLLGFIQFDITTWPPDTRVGLTGIAPWLTTNSASIAAAFERQYGYTPILTRASDALNPEEVERIGGEWCFQTAPFTQREGGGDTGFVRFRLPIRNATARLTKATVILPRPNRSLVAAGSYATFAPDR
jgi:hypothetical protein